MNKENKNITSLYADGFPVASFIEDSACSHSNEAWHFSGKVLEINSFDLKKIIDKSELISLINTHYFNKYDCLHILSFSESCNEFLEQNADHIVKLNNAGTAFEIKLRDDCPLSVIKMLPCFRHGDMTPWGGEKLKALFDKDIPDSSTGESMEISAINNLNSTDNNGDTLSKLQSKYGVALLGTMFDAKEQFPLLLKLLDAKGLLSIQVHPDDDYASEHENGKLGKEEAWVVLDCKENSKLIYGLKPNTTPEELSSCLKSGESPEKYMNYVYVKKGDVLHIAPGTVHALGSGIVVYEIQQSSDVTYRMWDWARKDKDGNFRQLHIDDSINCIKYEKELKIFSLPQENGVHTLLDVDSFKLYLVNLNGSETIKNDGKSFLTVTSFADTTIYSYDNKINLNNGESAIVPANLDKIKFEGNGLLLLAKANRKQ